MSTAALPITPLTTIDQALGGLLRQRFGLPALTGQLAATLSAALRDGHSAVDVDVLKHWLSEHHRLRLSGEPLALQLRDLPGVSDGKTAAPLVLCHAQLALYRCHAAEARLSATLTRLAQAAAREDDAVELPALLSAAQADAVRTGLQRQLLVLTGGPGTGKTTTVRALVDALLAQAARAGERAPRIALAAPTGKAAARMNQALSLGTNDATPDSVQPAGTLHRLLRYQSGTQRFYFDANNPLPLDVLIVDECSMLDLELADALLRALPEPAKLVLIGDADQLAAVEAGSLLAPLRALHQRLPPTHPLRSAQRQLTENRRATGPLSALASHVLLGDSAALAAALQSTSSWSEPSAATINALIQGQALPHYLALARSADPHAALQSLGMLGVLCATRSGALGTRAINQRIESALRAAQAGLRRDELWFVGRVVMVVENDYTLGLFNGDLGVTVRGENGLQVAFGSAQSHRLVAPSQLPAYEPGYALTVHKAQGSEFERVIVLAPTDDVPLLTREWLYTALTRAKSDVHLCLSADTLGRCLSRRTVRMSALAALLEAAC